MKKLYNINLKSNNILHLCYLWVIHIFNGKATHCLFYSKVHMKL
jgi:hypothetical protein